MVRDAVSRGISEQLPDFNVLTGLLKGSPEFTGDLPEHFVLPLEGYGTTPPNYVGIRFSGVVWYSTFALLPGEMQDPGSVLSDLKATMDALNSPRLRMSGEGRTVANWTVAPG